MRAKPSIESREGGAILRIRVQPKSSRNQVMVDPQGHIRATLTAAPADGQANRALIALLASRLGIPKSAINLSVGEKSRNKTVRVTGVDAKALREKLASEE